jgi:hypothetical protein
MVRAGRVLEHSGCETISTRASPSVCAASSHAGAVGTMRTAGVFAVFAVLDNFRLLGTRVMRRNRRFWPEGSAPSWIIRLGYDQVMLMNWAACKFQGRCA